MGSSKSSKVRIELFCIGIHSGLSQRKAYRKAFPESKNVKDSTVDNSACTLFAKEEVSYRLAELIQATRGNHIMSIKDKKERLSEIGLYGSASDSIRSIDVLNRMDGDYEKDNEQSRPEMVVQIERKIIK